MISIIIPYRNRDLNRVKACLKSLQQQTNKNFEVVFIDYGSDSKLAHQVKEVVHSFGFEYHYVHTQNRLWNKSISLNYGIKKANNPNIFIADVDIVFKRNAVESLIKKIKPEVVLLFQLQYLSKKESDKVYQIGLTPETKVKHSGTINGMVLATKGAFYKIHGYDEFYHFYGSEDVDLIERFKNAAYIIENHTDQLFYHLNHTIYNSYDDSKLSEVPRLFNAKRINVAHLRYHIKTNKIIPFGQDKWGEVFDEEVVKLLENPDVEIPLDTRQAELIHFLEAELIQYSNKVISLWVRKKPISLKTWLKKCLGKPLIPELTIKECNDLILQKIIFEYRNHNYSYVVSPDFKSINFRIQV